MLTDKDDKANKQITTAILMAAGMGTRIRPLSKDIPKPLIPIKGKPMIETLIESVKRAGIKEIVIVVGYKKEKYFYLKEKYGNITFIENKDYKTKNTISSFYAAKDLMRNNNCLICETDFYVVNETLIKKEVDKSRYLLTKTDGQDYEWGFKIENNKIIEVLRPKENIYLDHHMYGISYWLKDDLDKLVKEVEKVYGDITCSQKAYDEIANVLFDKIDMGYFEVQEGEIYEVDTLRELVELDKSYNKYLGGE